MAAAAKKMSGVENASLKAASEDPNMQIKSQTELKQMGIEAESAFKAGSLGRHCGTLFIRGKLWGWGAKYAVIDGQFLNLYNALEDIALANPHTSLDVSNCQANLCNASKYGRDHTVEVVISNPRSVHALAAESADLAEKWVDVLATIKPAEDEVLTGYVGNLTDEQTAKLEEAKTAIGDKLGDCTDADVLRFLRHNMWDIAAATKQWEENIIWREQFNVANLNANSVAREVRSGKMRVLPSTDKQGRPILCFQPGKHDPSTSSPIDVAKLFTYNLEYCCHTMMKDGAETLVILVDFSGFKPKCLDIRVPKMLLETMQNRYPQRIGLVLMVNAPWFYRFVWATIRSFMSEDILKRVHILGADMTSIQGFVPPECLLKEHGGIVDWGAEDFLKQRCEAEGIDLVPEDEVSERTFEGGVDSSLMESLKELSAEEASGGAVKVGSLTKLGGVVKNWKKRYFVLSESGLLYYFKEETSETPQGVIMLERSSVTDGGDETTKKDAFCLKTPLRTFVFCAETTEEMDAWKKAISDVIAEL